MILRLREGHKEITISKSEAEQLADSLAKGAEIIFIKGWMIAKGDIAHVDPSGLTKIEMDELDKRALPERQHERASPEKVKHVREMLEEKGIIKRKGEVK
jgi:hypothetical protein